MSQPTEPPAAGAHDVMVEEPSSQEARVRDGDRRIQGSMLQKVYDCIAYVPPRCRYDAEKPFKFSLGLNLLFGKGIPPNSLRASD